MNDDQTISDDSDETGNLPAEELEGEILEEVLDLPEKVAREIVHSVQTQMFAGPLPPPALLKEYEEALPGSAERIVLMAENEQKHRHQRDNTSDQLAIQTQQSEIQMQRWGLFFGFALGMTMFVGSFIVMLSGRELTGLAAIVAATVGLVGVIYSARRQPKPDNNSSDSTPDL